MADGDPDAAATVKGVGGWLALFVVVMTLFTPVAMVVTTMKSLYEDPAVAAAFGGLWGIIQIYEWSLAAIVALGCWYIAWRLNYVQTWQTVRITIIGIWLVGVGSLLADFVGISLIGGFPIVALAEEAGVGLVRPFVFGAIWTTYFLQSKRVANTYRRDGADVARVFG